MSIKQTLSRRSRHRGVSPLTRPKLRLRYRWFQITVFYYRLQQACAMFRRILFPPPCPF